MDAQKFQKIKYKIKKIKNKNIYKLYENNFV